MKLNLKPIIILIIGIIFTSCSHRLTGTWNIQKYETNSPGKQSITLLDIGKITFLKDGTGKNQIAYSVVGILKKDTTSFHWKATNKNITIENKNSEFGKTWIIIENQRKFQKWKSTDGAKQIQILELIR